MRVAGCESVANRFAFWIITHERIELYRSCRQFGRKEHQCVISDYVLTMIFGLGILLGLAVSAPVGPVALLCLRRAAVGFPAFAFTTGLGPASCDLGIGIASVMGVKAIFNLSDPVRSVLSIAAGVMMLGIAICGLWMRLGSHIVLDSQTAEPKPVMIHLFGGWMQGVLITLGNPINTIGTSLIFVAFSSRWNWLGIAGFAIGACLWWALLAWGVYWFSSKLPPTLLRQISRATYVMIGFMGALILVLGSALMLK